MGSSSARSGCSLGGSDEALLAAYRATTWSVRYAGRSIRIRPGHPAPGALGHFAVITAYNPASAATPLADNRRATRALGRGLAGRAWRPARAHGTGADARRWDEPGFAVLGPDARRSAVELGRALGQNAILAGAPGQPVVLVVTREGFCGRPVGESLEL